MNLARPIFALAVPVLGVTGSANAAVIANYSFSAASAGGAYLNPTSNDVNVTADAVSKTGLTGLSRATSTNGVPNQPFLNVSNSAFGSPNVVYATSSDAESAGSYFLIKVTASAGYVLDLDSLTFNTTKGGNGNRGFSLQTSATGFSNDDSKNIDDTGAVTGNAGYIPPTMANSSGNPSNTFKTYTLTDGVYNNLSSIEFRFFVFTPAAGNTVQFDDFDLNGTVVSAVPEPGSAALVLTANLPPLIRRRNRRQGNS